MITEIDKERAKLKVCTLPYLAAATGSVYHSSDACPCQTLPERCFGVEFQADWFIPMD
jgi:hypothetical protein